MGARGGGAWWDGTLSPELTAAAAFRGVPGAGGGVGGFAEFRQHAEGFIRAVDWREPWLVGVLAGHLALLTATVRMRRSAGGQMGIFLGASALIYGAETLNDFLAARWEAFATQNYFDGDGLFASVVLSSPLLLCCLVTQLNLLAILSRDLVRLKRMELRHCAREVACQKGGASPGGGKKKKKA